VEAALARPQDRPHPTPGHSPPRTCLHARGPCWDAACARHSSYCDTPRPAPLTRTPRAGPGTPRSSGSPAVPRDPYCHPALRTRTLSQPGAAPGPAPGSLPSSPFPPPRPQPGRLPRRVVTALGGQAGFERDPAPGAAQDRGRLSRRSGCCWQLKGKGTGNGPSQKREEVQGCEGWRRARGPRARWGLGLAQGPRAGVVQATGLPRASPLPTQRLAAEPSRDPRQVTGLALGSLAPPESGSARAQDLCQQDKHPSGRGFRASTARLSPNPQRRGVGQTRHQASETAPAPCSAQPHSSPSPPSISHTQLRACGSR